MRRSWRCRRSSVFSSGSFSRSLFRFLLFEQSNPLLHLFAGFKRYDVFFRDIDPFARPRIAGLSSRPLLHFEHAEVPKLNPMFAHKCVDDRVESLLDDLLRLQLGHPNLLGDRLHNIFFRHD